MSRLTVHGISRSRLHAKRDIEAHVEDVSKSVGLSPPSWLDVQQTANSWVLDQSLVRWENTLAHGDGSANALEV